jgi:hypothetical protein
MPNDPADTSALLVLRHGAFPIALNDAMWQKYKVGESLKINDPETKAPAVKNPFYKPKSGVLPIDDMALDRPLAKGTIVGACNVALMVQSKMLSGNAGVSADAAAKEWAANIIPGVTVIPSGTWGVNRAQFRPIRRRSASAAKSPPHQLSKNCVRSSAAISEPCTASPRLMFTAMASRCLASRSATRTASVWICR